MTYETTRVEQWIFEQLADDSTVVANAGANVLDATKAGVYVPQAPEGALYPLVRYNLMAGTDSLSMGTTRNMTDCVYQVLCVGQTESYQSLETLADRVDTLLTNPSDTTVDSHVIIGSWREQVIKIPELVSGTHYRSLGGLYRIHVRSA